MATNSINKCKCKLNYTFNKKETKKNSEQNCNNNLNCILRKTTGDDDLCVLH